MTGALTALLFLAGACAQPAVHRAQTPGVSPLVERAVEAPYLTEEEQRDARVFHGVWTPDDLSDPARRARAALIAGVWDDASFSDESVPTEDRAEAMLERGDLEAALRLLDGVASLRAGRVRAEALEGLGRFKEADAAAGPAIERLARGEIDDAPGLVEAVRTMRVRSRVRGLPAQDFQAMMALLARARQADPLYWPALLEEARLLHAKDNAKEAAAILSEATSLCPRAAGALELAAQMSVQAFNFDKTEALAASLDAAARSVSPGAWSAAGRIWLASAMLRQNDPDLAEEYLDPVRARFPRHRLAAATACAIAAVRYDADATEHALSAFDELSPGSPLGLYVAGRAMAENRQYERAAGLLERAVERRPNWPPPLVALGLMEVQAGRDDEARAVLDRAVELDPFQRRARNSLEMLDGLAAFDTIEGEHFRVRYKPGVDGVMAREMLPVLEEIYERDTTEFEHEPAGKTLIELMPDHEWFAVRITGMPDVHTIAAATGPLIAMEAPKIGPDHFGVYDWPRVLRHEFAHTVTLSRTNNRIPHWFTEAAAVNVEDAPRDYNTCKLLAGALAAGELFDMQGINIAFVRPKKPTDRGQAYAQGAWMYGYIKETFGERAPLELMDLYAQGVREDEAMRRVLGIGQDEFLAGFLEWARDDVRSWGMRPSPSMSELRLRAALGDDQQRAEVLEALRAVADTLSDAVFGVGTMTPAALPTPALAPSAITALLEEYPDHPGLLERAVAAALDASAGAITTETAGLLRRYAEAKPVDPEPHRLLARWLLARGDRASVEEAVEHLAYLDAREQYSPVLASERSRRLAELGRFEESSAAAERAVRISPFDANERELAATAALRLGDFETAERHIAALVELEPGRQIHRLRLEKVRERLGSAAEDAPGAG